MREWHLAAMGASRCGCLRLHVWAGDSDSKPGLGSVRAGRGVAAGSESPHLPRLPVRPTWGLEPSARAHPGLLYGRSHRALRGLVGKGGPLG